MIDRFFASLRIAASTALFVSATAAAAAPAFGTFTQLFAADSLWNSRPVDPLLGSNVVPKSDYFPDVQAGAWSTGLFLAKPDDPSVTVKGLDGKSGVNDVDSERSHDVTIPHWPRDLVPAREADGHADIVDPATGIVHSFWQLKKTGDQWVAALYAWTRLDGSGWGDPAHYYQGARAVAIPASAGLIRKHEVDDGAPLYRHALALSLTFNGLARDPTYVFPATAADGDAASTNTGTIPEGTLLMLPRDFAVDKLATASLRKVAETLKTYGAYVVDRNTGTPFVIYVEIGSDFTLHKGGWNNAAAADLDRIRDGLRPVVSTKGWVDGNGKAFTPERRLNILSMRGPWTSASGEATGTFDTLKQAVVFPSAKRVVQTSDSGRLTPVAWAVPRPGQSYRLTAIATGNATLRIVFRDKATSKDVYDSGELANGKSARFKWPASGSLVVTTTSGDGGPSTVRGDLVPDESAGGR